RISELLSLIQTQKKGPISSFLPSYVAQNEKVFYLVTLNRDSLTLGYIPKPWRRVKVTLISKLGGKKIIRSF
ncbi:hypothetical protein J6590_068359, partial [Homalodisca vitripennis]